MSRPEIDQLAGLLHETVLEIRTDGWAVNLKTGQRTTMFIPEEVATPIPDFDLADVERLRVASEPKEIKAKARTTNLGRIESLDVLNTVVRFTVSGNPPAMSSREMLPSSEHAASGNAEVDIGIVVRLSDGRELFIYACGFFVEYSFDGLRHDDDTSNWARLPITDLRDRRERDG